MTTTTSETKEEMNNILVGGMKGWERKQDVIEKQLLFPLLWMKSPLKGSWSFTETLLLHILLTLPREEEDLPVTWQWTEEEAVVDLLARYRSPVMDDYLLFTSGSHQWRISQLCCWPRATSSNPRGRCCWRTIKLSSNGLMEYNRRQQSCPSNDVSTACLATTSQRHKYMLSFLKTRLWSCRGRRRRRCLLL